MSISPDVLRHISDESYATKSKFGKVAIIGVSVVGLGIAGTACNQIPTEVLTSTPVNTLVPGESQKTPTSDPVKTPETTPTTQINADFPSPFADYYFGTYAEAGQTKYTTAVDGSLFENNKDNKGLDCTVPTVAGAHESQLDTLYTKANPQLPAAFLVDQNYLTKYFNAETIKTGTIGALADGTPVEYIDNVWVIHQTNGPDLVFNPLVISESGKPFGYPVICEKNNTLMRGITDNNGALVSGSTLEAAFQPAATVAKNAGYMGDLSKIVSVGINASGQMELTLKDGSRTRLNYIIDIQSQLDELSASGITGCTYHDGNIYNSEGKIISIDSLGVITTPSKTGLSWWNSETKNWVVTDPINPETYPAVYLEHWNGLATRTPVSEATAEDIAFNDFQIETYRDFFPSVQSNLNQDPLWQAFFQTNGSDFSAMSADQIYQASLLYGQTSKEVIMPIVLMEQQNQANPNNWKFSDQTSSQGLMFPVKGVNIDILSNVIRQNNSWGFNQNLLGTNIYIDSIPISQINGLIQAQFRIPGVSPDAEVGLAISFDGGKHLDVGASFQDVTISHGDQVIEYHDLDKNKIITPSPSEQTFLALTDQWKIIINSQQLKELIGTSRTLDVGKYIGNSASGNAIDIFSKNSGLQLVGDIFRTKSN
jgi:hypothetical protein